MYSEKLMIAKIKKVFKENFLRELSDEEAKEFLGGMLAYTKKEVSKTPDFTEKKFSQYLHGEPEIVFSP